MNGLYLPPQHHPWTGRQEAEPYCYVHERVALLNLQDPHTPTEGSRALLGFAVDEGIARNGGRVGAKEGPLAFRKALAKLALPQEIETPIYDAGDITCREGDLEASREALSKAVKTLHERHVYPLLIGGGHEIAFPHYLGLFQAYPGTKIGILQLDAHFDMRPLKEGKGTSGTSFGEIADHAALHRCRFDHLVVGIQPLANNRLLFARAEKEKSRWVAASEIDEAAPLVNQLILRNDLVYVSLCLDVLAAPFALGVSAPQSLGLFPQQVQSLLEIAFQSPKTVAFDIAELSPPHDVGQMTAQLAAHFAMQWFQRKRGR